ncbi:MAG: hypothetical protein K0S46_1378 [Moraxellaceae bacterium]|jgi:hypothetical protein|nr:hypothetical protein [Moraxellaceae bacterium]
MDAWLNKLLLRGAELRGRWGLQESGSPLFLFVLAFLIVQLGLGWYWGRELPTFAVGAPDVVDLRPGGVLAASLAQVGERLTGKPGGYLRNDLMPPGVLLDNVPAWEKGALVQARDLVHVMYQGTGQPSADADLAEAEAGFAVADDSWAMPSAEAEIRRGSLALERYGRRLGQGGTGVTAFDERHLLQWLAVTNERLERMSARLNAALPAYSAAPAVPALDGVTQMPETSWWAIDDVFYEARGSAWTLLHLLKAAEIEFRPLLARRHAELSLRAAIHELEATQQPVWSPLVLNGSGFGLFGNHSLVMANYLNRVQADLEDVLVLLRAGQ